MQLSQEVHDSGQEVAASNDITLPDTLNTCLGRFVGWPFKEVSGRVIDREGNGSETFASVVYATPEGTAPQNAQAIPADSVAAVIDGYASLNLEGFRAAYQRIVQVKRLRKRAAPTTPGVPSTTVTLGIIFALRSALPLEVFAQELECLNSKTPSREWPDMVVVAAVGTINYALQFPGDPPSGNFLPPAEGAVANSAPAIYVVIVMTPAVPYTFNKMAAFLIAHLAIFSPGAQLPDWSQILVGVPQNAVAVSGFQYDLKGELLPVPRRFYNDRYLAPLPMRIEDKKGKLLPDLCTRP